jgi:SAM-dependent methyltransferase
MHSLVNGGVKVVPIKMLRLVLAQAVFLALVACGAEGPRNGSPAEADGVYTMQPGSPDGIGKYYMGREIAQVMGHLGAGWLERDSRVAEERTDLLVENLPLQRGDTVVDLGAGTGYFTLLLAEKVPAGRVLAVDIQSEMLDIVAGRVAALGLSNVETVRATETDPRLSANSVDLVLIVDAYHEFSHPREVMQRVAQALKPSGKVVLIEYRGEDPSVPIKELHKMTEQQARRELAAVGLSWLETRDFLPQQHFMLFGREAARR